MDDPKALADDLDEMARGTRDLEAEALAISKHFSPAYDACWQDGVLVNQRDALRLRVFVIERANDARRLAKEAAVLERAAEFVRAALSAEPQSTF